MSMMNLPLNDVALPFDMSRGELSMHFSRFTFHLSLRLRLCLSLMMSIYLEILGFDVHLPLDLQRTEEWDEG